LTTTAVLLAYGAWSVARGTGPKTGSVSTDLPSGTDQTSWSVKGNRLVTTSTVLAV
jgi:hypothetical protein